MKIFRFMSIEEFKKYNDGKKLTNNRKHEGKTNSVGFCFLNLEEYTPEEAMHFLSGVVTFDICAVFENEIYKWEELLRRIDLNTEKKIEHLVGFIKSKDLWLSYLHWEG